jgi:hypothetical protein
MPDDDPPLIIRVRSRSREIEHLTRPMFNDELTPQAIAGHRRSARERVRRHRKTWGLLADVVEFTPAPTLEEHRARQRAASVARFERGRKDWADAWRKVRARLRELPRDRALELLAAWNARACAARGGPSDLLGFLNEREPTPAILHSRRHGRLTSAQIHRDVARRSFSWYVAHRTCPEGDFGVAEVASQGTRRVLRCIACLAEWHTAHELARAQTAGDLEIVDCRLAEQLDLL